MVKMSLDFCKKLITLPNATSPKYLNVALLIHFQMLFIIKISIVKKNKLKIISEQFQFISKMYHNKKTIKTRKNI